MRQSLQRIDPPKIEKVEMRCVRDAGGLTKSREVSRSPTYFETRSLSCSSATFLYTVQKFAVMSVSTISGFNFVIAFSSLKQDGISSIRTESTELGGTNRAITSQSAGISSSAGIMALR